MAHSPKLGTDRWANVHVQADRRRPYGHIGQRTAEPARLTANQVSARILIGMLVGAILTLLCAGTPW